MIFFSGFFRTLKIPSFHIYVLSPLSLSGTLPILIKTILANAWLIDPYIIETWHNNGLVEIRVGARSRYFIGANFHGEKFNIIFSWLYIINFWRLKIKKIKNGFRNIFENVHFEAILGLFCYVLPKFDCSILWYSIFIQDNI